MGERWSCFGVWGDTLTTQRGLPTAVTWQGTTLGGRKFLICTKEARPGQVQMVTRGGGLDGDALSGPRSAGEAAGPGSPGPGHPSQRRAACPLGQSLGALPCETEGLLLFPPSCLCCCSEDGMSHWCEAQSTPVPGDLGSTGTLFLAG